MVFPQVQPSLRTRPEALQRLPALRRACGLRPGAAGDGGGDAQRRGRNGGARVEAKKLGFSWENDGK